MGRTLADLGAAQSKLQGLDDDFYVRGVLAEGAAQVVSEDYQIEYLMVTTEYCAPSSSCN